MDMEKCIEIQNLQKSFGAIHAVNNLSLQVETGQLFAFLGVNGAGKSTTISMICGQLRQDAGQIYVNGRNTLKNMNAIKQDIGVVFQNSVLDRQLSVQDNLKNRAALYGITGKAFQKRLFELDDLLELRPLLKQSVGKLSGGQRRRIDIARAIFHRPQLLILDEPTTGPADTADGLECHFRPAKEKAHDRFSDDPLYGRGCRCRPHCDSG